MCNSHCRLGCGDVEKRRRKTQSSSSQMCGRDETETSKKPTHLTVLIASPRNNPLWQLLCVIFKPCESHMSECVRTYYDSLYINTNYTITKPPKSLTDGMRAWWSPWLCAVHVVAHSFGAFVAFVILKITSRAKTIFSVVFLFLLVIFLNCCCIYCNDRAVFYLVLVFPNNIFSWLLVTCDWETIRRGCVFGGASGWTPYYLLGEECVEYY